MFFKDIFLKIMIIFSVAIGFLFIFLNTSNAKREKQLRTYFRNSLI